MDCFFWPYELTPRRRLSAIAAEGVRRGALIRVGDGFADVHPWPELGDAPLDAQLASIAAGAPLPLARRSLALASLDGEARRASRSLFDGLTIPPSHWPGADPPDSFEVAKLKSMEAIPERVRLRIDFNATLTPAGFLRIAETLPRERVDFVEDPCPYDAAIWRELRSRGRLRLALDRGVAEDGVDVLVVKPAVQEMPSTSREVVVTSYMDHAVGQMFAAYVAAAHRVSSVCGLFTHVLYERDAFFDRIAADGPRLRAPAGTGIGFDDLLEGLPWRRIA
jgi:o-succinylbenzoate synthase